MNAPHLIQRGNIENRDWKKGIDSIIKLQYMGSAEFEFGAVPDSLERIRENIDRYVKFNYKFEKTEDKVVTIFCNEKNRVAAGIILEGLANCEYTLQEYSDINNYVYPDDICECGSDFWWDIDNDWMCWVQNEEFSEKFDGIIDGSYNSKEEEKEADAEKKSKINIIENLVITNVKNNSDNEKFDLYDLIGIIAFIVGTASLFSGLYLSFSLCLFYVIFYGLRIFNIEWFRENTIFK